jgi:hypothetical protein
MYALSEHGHSQEQHSTSGEAVPEEKLYLAKANKTAKAVFDIIVKQVRYSPTSALALLLDHMNTFPHVCIYIYIGGGVSLNDPQCVRLSPSPRRVIEKVTPPELFLLHAAHC